MKTVVLSLALLIHGITYGQNFVWVFLNKKENKEELPAEEIKKIMDGHLANIKRLAKEGKLLAAGPFEEGGGIFVFDSHSKVEVNEWLATDPGIQAKRWDIELFLYTPRTGSVCSVGEKYEMTLLFCSLHSATSKTGCWHISGSHSSTSGVYRALG